MRSTRLIPACVALAVLAAALPPTAGARALPLDPTFGNAGVVESAFGPSFSQMEFARVDPQPDGSILAALGHGSEAWIWQQRYGADGNRDQAYGRVGFRPEPEAVQTDGKVLRLAGEAALLRLEPDGTSDPSFGTQPYGLHTRSDTVPFQIDDILPLPSGGIIVAGKRMKSVPGPEEPRRVFDQLAIAHYDEKGKLDSGFGGDGVVLLGDEFGFRAEGLTGIAPRPAGGVTLLAADTVPSHHGEAVTHSGTSLLGLTSAGVPDPDYGKAGAAHLEGLVTAFRSLAGGSVLLAGDAWGGPLVPGRSVVSSDLFLARYGDDGRPDASFAAAGKATLDFGGLDLAKAMLVQPDGSIVLGGATTQTGDSYCLRFSNFCDEEPVLAKLTPSGQPDPTFGDGGQLRLTTLAAPHQRLEDNVGITALAPLPGEHILAGGGSGPAAFLAKLTPGGALELSFGDGGTVAERDPSPGQAAAHAIGVDGRGRILVAGGTDSGLTHRFLEAAVFRYLPGGMLDTSYGEGLGYVRVPAAARLAVADDGSVVVSSDQTPMNLTRIKPNGELDNSFGEGGTATQLGPRRGAKITSIAMLPSGGVVTSGTSFTESRIVVFRTRADGSLNPIFGKGGVATLVFGSGHPSQVGEMTVDARGRIVIVGSVDDGDREALAAIRVLPDGRLDRSFGRDGVARPRVGGRSFASAVDVQPDGKILIAGRVKHGSVRSDLLLQLRANGALDRRFAHRGVSLARVPEGDMSMRGPRTILKLPRRILVLRRGTAEQVLAYRPGGRLERTFHLPVNGASPQSAIQALGAIQGSSAVLAAQIRFHPHGAFELLRPGLR
jgi:uncharacterized delta-60 repeat protein